MDVRLRILDASLGLMWYRLRGRDMPPSDDDPPESGDLPRSDSDDPSESGDLPRSDPEAASQDDEDESSDMAAAREYARVHRLAPVTPEMVREFIGHRETRAALRAFIAGKVPADSIDDLVSAVVVEALSDATRAPPMGKETMVVWLRLVARRVVVAFLRKRARRAKYEGRMPNEPVQSWSPDDDEAAPPWEPGHDPRDSTDEWKLEAGRLVRWLEGNAARDPRDAETLQILLEHAREGKTYGQIAQERGLTLTAVSSRIFEFKIKYMPRYRRERDRANMLWILLGAAIVAIVVALWWLLRPVAPRPQLVPSPSHSASPSPSATTSAAPFEPAGSTPRQEPSDLKRPPPDSKTGR